MDELVRVREYEFSGPVPEDDIDLVTADTCRTIYLNALMKPERIQEKESLTKFEYDESGCLQRMVKDYRSGHREVWTYEYDETGERIHVRCVQMVEVHGWIPADGEPAVLHLWYRFFDDWKFMPTGYETDEWYEWEEEGRVCHRRLTIRKEDGTVEDSVRTDRYDDAGRLTGADYTYGDGTLFHSDRYEYRKDGSLRREDCRHYDRDGTVWSAYSVLYDRKERKVARKKADAVIRRYRYSEHECGLWDRRTEFGRDGRVKGEIIRIIERI